MAATLASVSVSAQTQSSWTALSGIEQFSLRDIARFGPPVDASPVSWEGAGPVLVVRRDRQSPSRRHGLEVTLAGAGSFEYRSPFGSYAAVSDDGARRVEGRYEYDRRILTRRLPTFIEAVVGVRASGQYLSLTHHVDPSWDIGLSTRSAAAAIVVGGTFGRGRRLWADVQFGNAVVIGWLQPHGDVSGTSAGGWTTDLEGGVNLQTTTTLSVAVRIATRGDTFLGSHRSFSTSTPRVTLGVRYAK
jgi:hypothetical protein